MKRIAQPSTYNREATAENAFNIIDNYGMMTTSSPPNFGRGDCIGRTYEAYIAYKDERLVESVIKRWSIDLFTITPSRHPLINEDARKFSRDHYVYSLCAMILSEDALAEEMLNFICWSTPKDIKGMMRFTLTLILWSKSLIGNKRAELWFYILDLLIVNLLYRPIHYIGRNIANWSEEVDQENWVLKYAQHKPQWKMWVDKIIYPSFAIHLKGHQLYVMGDNYPRLKRWLKKSYLSMVGKTNYVQHMLFGKEVPREKIVNYKHMRGGRWSGYLSDRNKRVMYVFEEGMYKYNQLDRDYAIALFNDIQAD